MSFKKCLTVIDIESRLKLPDHFVPENDNFHVRNQTGLTWTFRVSSIPTGSDRRNVSVSAGWLSFVRDRKLKIGDLLSISREFVNGGPRVLYRIEVKRRLQTNEEDDKNNKHNSNGSDHWTRLV